jgi:hypothetical protein
MTASAVSLNSSATNQVCCCHTRHSFLNAQEEIDSWLTATAGGDVDDGEADLPPSSLDPVGKRKRAAAAEGGERAPKVARSGANPLGTQLDEQVCRHRGYMVACMQGTGASLL